MHRSLTPLPLFRRRILFMAAALLSVGSLAAQTFVGSDDFNDNTLTIGSGNRWITTYGLGAGLGTYAESGGTLNFTSSGEDTQFLRWSNTATSGSNFATPWTASINVTNNGASPGAGYITSGLQIYTLFDSGGSLSFNSYYAIMLINQNGNLGIVTEWAKYDEILDGFDITSNFVDNGGDVEDVTLRLSWGADNLLTSSYSLDGINFITGQVFDVSESGAEAGYAEPYNDSFGLELFVRSADGAGAVTGGVSFDNMVVSAVPEPSTYAAIAGAAFLGFAVWRRRRVA